MGTPQANRLEQSGVLHLWLLLDATPSCCVPGTKCLDCHAPRQEEGGMLQTGWGSRSWAGWLRAASHVQTRHPHQVQQVRYNQYTWTQLTHTTHTMRHT